MNGLIYNLYKEEDAYHLNIFEDIENKPDFWTGFGFTPEKFANEINGIPSDAKLVIHINSYGGVMDAGFAIYNMLNTRKVKAEAVIESMCASIATVIAMACSPVKMAESGTFLVHKPMSGTYGNADDFAKSIELLDFYEDKLVKIYASRTGLSEDKLHEMIAKETWLSATDAKALGFVDEIIPNNEKVKNYMQSARLQAKNLLVLNKKTLNQQTINKQNIMPNNINEPAPAPAVKPQNAAGEDNNVTALLNRIQQMQRDNDALKNQNEAFLKAQKEARDAEIKNLIQAAIDAGKIANTESDKWTKMMQASKDADELLNNLPAKPTNGVAVHGAIDLVSPDVRNVAGEICRVGVKNRERGSLLKEHYNKLLSYCIQNSATVSSDLKQHVILRTALEQFAIITGDVLKLFTTVFKDQPLAGTDTVLVPYYPLWNVTPKQFYYPGESPDTSTNPEGYTSDTEYNVINKSIVCNKREFVGLRWKSYDINRTPFYDINRFVKGMATSLGVKINTLVQGQITAANFPYTAFASPIALSALTSTKLADAYAKCMTMNWLPIEQQMVLHTLAATELKKDPYVLSYAHSNQDDTLKRGRLPMIQNFVIHENPNIPNNGEDLFGYICMPEALGIVNAPIRMDENIPGRYGQETDPDSKLTLELRWGGDFKNDMAFVYLEFNCGFGVLEPAALLRMVKAS